MSITRILRSRNIDADRSSDHISGRPARLVTHYERSGKGWFWETDVNGDVTYISEHVGSTIGRRIDELIGCRFGDLIQADGEDDSGSSGRSLAFYFSSRVPFADLVARARSSAEIWWSLSGSPLHDGVGRFLGFSGMATDLTEKHRSEVELARLARYDSLTGLPNRAMVQRALDDAILSALHRKRRCAVLLLDLDRFKAVNDTLGHPTGDALLRAVAGRLKTVLADTTHVGRLGGDEFQIILPDFEDKYQLTRLAERIIDELSRLYVIDGRTISVGASVGIAISDLEGSTAHDLVRDADLALYSAKASGRGTFRFFSSELLQEAEARQILESDLEAALDLGQMHVAFQPSVDLETEKVTGFEALVRWQHPTRGSVSPAAFIPLAEDIGAINTIGEWVLRQSCHEAAKWPDHVKVAVNLSPVQFTNRSLPAIVANALASAQLPARRLELEITEGVLLGNDEHILEMIASIQRLGVRLALDDFGTGYSSLGYLRKVSFDKIKIDQSFVRGASIADSKNAPIIRAIVGLASALGMQTTAEGVETQDELQLVRELGCTLVQGYIYGKPMNADEAFALVHTDGPAAQAGFQRARAERRRLIRSGFLHHSGRSIPVKIRNISCGGAMIEYSSPLEVGASFALDLSLDNVLHGCVRWSNGKYVGLEFTETFDLRTLSSLNGKATTPAALVPDYLSSSDHPHSPFAIEKERFTPRDISHPHG